MSVEQRPTFHDLQTHAGTGVAKRVIARYLIPTNYERSIKWHERLKTPLVQDVVMSTIGHFATREGSYHLSNKKPAIDAMADFAIKKSVSHETFHTVSLIAASYALVESLTEGYPLIAFPAIALTVCNIPLIALQRYNRARMVRAVDRELKRGKSFSSEYRNWLGIDAKAVENFDSTKKK